MDFQELAIQKANVEYVFELAARYASQGDLSHALTFYEKGLKLDGWRWDRHLAFARILYRAGSFEAALDHARMVHLYSEDNSLVEEAEEVLRTMGFDPSRLKSQRAAKRLGQTEIILVPIGKTDLRLIEEVREELQSKAGIVYSIAKEGLDPGETDQTGADRYLEELSAFFKEQIPPERMDELLAEQKLRLEDLRTVGGMVHFLERIADAGPFTENLAAVVYRELKELEQDDWFDAVRLSRLLEHSFPMGKTGARGYLGICGTGLFRGTEALRAWYFPGEGYAVMTYWPLTGRVSQREENRPRLRSRFVKEALFYSFEILGIPDCLVPTCARAYSQNSASVDQKGEDLCAVCQEMLANYLKGVQPGIYPSARVVREAQTFMGEGRYGEAMEAFKRARQLNPADLEANLLQARLYDDSQHLQEALTLYRDLLKRHPHTPRVVTDFLWFCADHTWWPDGEDEAAVVKEGLREAEKALERWAEEPDFLEAYGWLAYQSGQPERAEQLLQQAVAYRPTPQKFYVLSIVFSELKNKEQALWAYQEAKKRQQEGQKSEDIYAKGFRQMAETMLEGSR